MYYKLFFSLSLFVMIFHKAQKNNLALSIPVTDEYFGIKIVDEYRNLENLKDQNTIDWMSGKDGQIDHLISE